MISVNRKGQRLHGSVEGKPFSIPFDQDKYEDLKVAASRLEMCTSKEAYMTVLEEVDSLISINMQEEAAAVNGFLKYRKNTGTYHLVIDKGTAGEIVSDIPMPTVLAERIVESYEEGADYMPLVLAWRRFLTRPNGKAEDNEYFARYLTSMYVNQKELAEYVEEGATWEAAEELATYNDLAITSYGLLATYKVVDIIKQKWVLEKDADGVETRKLVDRFPSTKEIDDATGEVTTTEGKPEFLEEMVFEPAIHSGGDKFFCGEKLSYIYKIGKEAILPEDATRNFENTFGGGGLSMAA